MTATDPHTPEASPPVPADTAPAPTRLRGHALIADYVSRLDTSPGVYRMLNDRQEVLYVGKARNLKARVTNYTRLNGHSARINRMIRETAYMMFLTTRTETEALLLEQNLIKQLKPRYNVLLRDDKSFPYILIDKSTPYPEIRKHRGSRSVKGAYFGPFASAAAVNRTLNHLERVFQLRNCSDAMFASRTRPCLQFQIKRCSAPCVGKIPEIEYLRTVADAERFLQGKTTSIQKDLAAEMMAASEALEFERAAALRDRIQALTTVQQSQGINPRGVAEADVIAVHMEGGQACVQVFFIRAHQSWGNHDFYPKTGSGAEEPEILEAFLGQFYDSKEPPRLLLLSHAIEDGDLMEQALAGKAGHKVEIIVPQRGEKAELVENALRNARESLGRRMSESAATARLLAGVAAAFGLPRPPERIEVYDNSHIQGTNAVGGMICAGPDGFLKSQYRKWNIKGADLTPGDDFGMMKEVLTRRFARLIKEDPDRKTDIWPDLLLIDGGAGQVSAVRQIMEQMGVTDIPMVGVAKGIDRDQGKEEFHRIGQRPFALPRQDPVLYYIQRLRDEAHRWAIGAHRAKRAKSQMANPLDEIPGIGATRKRALLQHFGSAKAVSRAGVSDMTEVPGISQATAETVWNFFNDNG
ncbi:MAG TPA: excinuclease ABC subunit UvrC [Paenirhodobacter sp.]